jgi:hypothetical protein
MTDVPPGRVPQDDLTALVVQAERDAQAHREEAAKALLHGNKQSARLHGTLGQVHHWFAVEISKARLRVVAQRQEQGVDCEQIALLIEVEERTCRQKEHDGRSHHARSIWGACAATCGVLAAQVRKLGDRAAAVDPPPAPRRYMKCGADYDAGSAVERCINTTVAGGKLTACDGMVAAVDPPPDKEAAYMRARLASAFATLYGRLLTFNERVQELRCTVCRYRDRSFDTTKLHSDDCPLWSVYQLIAAVPAVDPPPDTEPKP